MLKKERHEKIIKAVNSKGIITTQELMQILEVSDMTIRRDLEELNTSGKLIRIHGGAQSVTYSIDIELSHTQKQVIHMEEKLAIARYAANLIKDHDTIYLGPGTTIELMASMIRSKPDFILTNSLPVFETLKDRFEKQLILCGGTYRNHTGCFVGTITNEQLGQFNLNAAFISCNGISNENISTSSLEEGKAQAIALKHSRQRYLLADHSKFNRQDLYNYYSLYNIDEAISDPSLSEELAERYSIYTKIQKAETDN